MGVEEKVEKKRVGDRAKDLKQGDAQAEVEDDDEENREDEEPRLPVSRWTLHRMADTKKPVWDAKGEELKQKMRTFQRRY